MSTFTPRSAVKVLHVQKAKGIGGSERHLLILLPALAAAGLEVKMCVLLTDGGEVFVDELRAHGVETATVPAGPDVNPVLLARLRSEIRAFGPDLVHTHLVHADLHAGAGAALTRTPRVSTVHGPGEFTRALPVRTATRLVGKLCPLTIAISHHLRDKLEDTGQRGRGTVRVVHYGIDTAGWSASETERTELREAFGLAPDDVAVAICARLIPGKGHELLLDAVALARDRAPSLRVLVAGDGPLRERLERRAAQLPPQQVRFLGFLNQVGDVMKACDVLAFPTSPKLDEGFGLAALEAMAAERAVIATRVGPLPEVVDAGRTGLVVAPEDPAALADALVELATRPDLAREMGRRGRDRAQTEFGVERMVSRTLAVYREAVGEA